MRHQILAITFSLVCAVLLHQTAFAQDGCIEDKGKADAVGAVRAEGVQDLPLHATLLPELTDDLISLEIHGLAQPIGAEPLIVRFYRVTLPTYQVEGTKIKSETVELDNRREWLAAVSGDHIFLLRGSTDPVGAFNKLATRAHLHVTDADSALAAFDFFLNVARGSEYRSQVIGDEMKLQSVALEDFRLRFPSANRKNAFSSWWNAIPESAKKALIPPKASQVKTSFEVQYFSYDKGTISNQRLVINSDGTIVQGKSKVVVKGL